MHNPKNIFFRLSVVLTSFLLFQAGALALEIKNLRFGDHGTAIRTVLDIDAETDFRAMVQDTPPRIVIDTPMLSGKPTIKRSILPQAINDIRLEPLAGKYSRITLLLNRKCVIRSAFVMPASASQNARLVIDMAPSDDKQFASQSGKAYGTLVMDRKTPKIPFAAVGGTNLKPITTPTAPLAPVVEKLKTPDELPLIMIDAGHGGPDAGAVQSGVEEKNITLAVARDLAEILKAGGKYRVKMTRDKDFFIRLQERVRIARREGADLFISIHADSMPEAGNRVKGASFYTISERASDAQAASLAARENKADMLSGVELPVDDKEVADILIDLTMRETVSQSRYFARKLVAGFSKSKLPLLDSPHKQAGFMVLKAPDIPSVLIELGFVSNSDEAKKLSDDSYRKTLSAAIAGSIDDWFKTKKH